MLNDTHRWNTVPVVLTLNVSHNDYFALLLVERYFQVCVSGSITSVPCKSLNLMIFIQHIMYTSKNSMIELQEE